MSEWSQALSGHPEAGASSTIQTISGNRGLQIEEKLIFEQDSPGHCGVDLPEPPAFRSRLGGLDRKGAIGLPGLSEPQVVRHFTRLSQKNYAIDTGLYPLGSCTMKHNPRLNEKLARLPGLADIHPLQPVSTVPGGLELIDTLAHWLKTLATPHGGGGPGSGPVALSASLAPFAPLPWIVHGPDGLELVEHKTGPAEDSLGRLKGFHGQMGMFVRALAYMMSHGSDGLRQVAEDAVLNANYLRVKLQDALSVAFPGTCMHEVLFDDAFLKDTGVTTLDFAKALIDEGFHPMTMYFPLVVHGALLIEPTETESRASLDQFAAVLIGLAARAKTGDAATFRNAPYLTPRRRLDETTAARNPVLRWRPPPAQQKAAE